MTKKSFRLKSHKLVKRYGQDRTLYRIAKDGGVNYSTLHRWMDQPDGVSGINSDIMFGFLAGLGLSRDEIQNLTLGDVFDFPSDTETQ